MRIIDVRELFNHQNELNKKSSNFKFEVWSKNILILFDKS